MPLVTEGTMASTGNAPAKAGWMAGVTTALGRIGADPGDDQELRQKKTLLVLLAVLIAPVSVIWGILYLALGSCVGFDHLEGRDRWGLVELRHRRQDRSRN